jgi:hypothetical protein
MDQNRDRGRPRNGDITGNDKVMAFAAKNNGNDGVSKDCEMLIVSLNEAGTLGNNLSRTLDFS